MNSNILVIIISSAIFYGTPLYFAALGGVLTERSGVLNLGVEGTMLIGAVAGAWGAQHVGGSSWITMTMAIIIGMVAGGLLSSLLAFLCITLKVNQTVAGLAVTIFAGAVGLSSYFAKIWGSRNHPSPVRSASSTCSDWPTPRSSVRSCSIRTS